MLRRWKPAVVILGGCAVVVAVSGYTLLQMASRAASNLFSPPTHGAAYVYSLESGRLDKVWDQAAFEVAWGPGANRIWVSDANHPGDSGRTVHEVDLVTGKSKKVFEIGDGGYVSLLPGPGMIAFAKGGAPPLEINVWTTDGGRLSFGEGNYPALTADGSRLTFVRPTCAREPTVIAAHPTDPNSQHVRAVDGGQSLERDFGTTADGRHSVSPNHAYLVYWKDAYSTVYLRERTTGREIVLGDGFADVKWRPDSSLFAIVLRPSGFRDSDDQILAVVRAADGVVIHTIELSLIERHFDPESDSSDWEFMTDFEWSPAGDRLAIGVAGGGTWYPPCGT